MRVGIVGFAGSGKSTLFQLLTGTRPDPGKIHAGQVGVATLSDPRLDYLAALHIPKKVTPATRRVSGHARAALWLARRQPPAPRPDPRRGCPADCLERLRGRRPGSPARGVSRRAALRRSEVVTSRAERLEASVKKASARPRAITEGARHRQGRAGGPRRGQVRSPRSSSRPMTRSLSDRSAS